MNRGVVVIGAGQAGAEAALTLRQLGYDGPVTVFGAEDLPPYSRPPLSKDFLTGALPIERMLLRTASAYLRANITIRLGEAVVALDPAAKTVTAASGDVFAYGACVLATGSSARRLPVSGEDLGGVLALRERGDADRLRELLKPGARIVIAGAGYLGLEIAASARNLGAEVTVIEAAARLLGRSTSFLTAGALAARHRREGVDLLLGCQISALEGEGTVREVVMADGRRIAADVVIASIGAVPAVDIARKAGIICGVGVLADIDCRTSAPDVYAIGDCAEWDMGDGCGPLRLESVQMASQGARTAAAAIVGAARPKPKLPYFWSQQYDLKLQIAGFVTAGVETEDALVGDAEGAFAVMRKRDGVLVSVEAVNMPAKYIEAQRLIGQPLRQYA